MKLDQEGSERILDAVRTLTPEGINIYRKGSGNLIIKYKSARFEWHTASSPAFSHISRRNSQADALAIGYQRALREVTNFLTGVELRWPGLAWGPVEVNVEVEQSAVGAQLTDVEGHKVTFPTLHTASKDLTAPPSAHRPPQNRRP